jgi:hypothetical protein
MYGFSRSARRMIVWVPLPSKSSALSALASYDGINYIYLYSGISIRWCLLFLNLPLWDKKMTPSGYRTRKNLAHSRGINGRRGQVGLPWNINECSVRELAMEHNPCEEKDQEGIKLCIRLHH